MVSAYECEIRFFIQDIEEFKEKLRKKGKLLKLYQFRDYYYGNYFESFNFIELTKESFRIREWIKPQKPHLVYFTKNEIIRKGKVKFKKSLLKEGKLVLFKSYKFEECEKFLENKNLKFLFRVEKEKGELWYVKGKTNNFCIVIELIKPIGWLGEIEVEGSNLEKAIEQIEKILVELEIDYKHTTPKGVGEIYLEYLHGLNYP